MAVVAFVFAATGHAAVLGVAELVTGTVIVHEAPVICRPATVIVLLPAVAVTVPLVQVPPTTPAPTARPAGKVSVNEKVCVGFVAGCVTVKVSVVGAPPIVIVVGENALVSAGVAAVTVKHWSTTLLVRFVVPVIAVVAFVFAATGHAAVLGVADGETGTVIVHEVPVIWRPATVIVFVPVVAVTVPLVHVPPTAPAPIVRPEGSVSVKLNVCVGLPAGCVTVKVNVEGAPPMVTVVGENAFVIAGVAAVTVKHWSTTLLVRLVVPVIAVVAFVLAATGHAAVLGVAEFVIGTVIVQEVPVIWRPATVMVLVPAVAVTVPLAHVPPTAPAPTARPEGNVSVKLNVCVGLLAGCVTVNVRVEGVPPIVIEAGANAFVIAGVAAVTVRHWSTTLLVRLVIPVIAVVALVFAATGHAAVLGVAEFVTGTVIVHDAPVIWRPATVIVLEPAVAVTVPLVQVPPTAPAPTARPEGSVSVKENVCVGLPAGCVTVKVSVEGVPPIVMVAGENAFVMAGVAAVTETHAPVVLVPPPAAELPIAAVTFVVAVMAPLPLVLFATGQAPTLGVADVATGTVIVQDAPETWRPATVIVPLPAVAVTVPLVHVPPTAPAPTARPAGSVSVNENVCVGLFAGCEIVNVSVVGAPPTVRPPPNALFSDGVAAVTVRH
jgi:uncharacterized metal-binding protein